MQALLALEDGTLYRGTAFGATGTSCGEVCFNTSMSGYQEVLTDPSYRGQIVAMTYPEIGNYGIHPDDNESAAPQVAGFVIRNLSPIASNWRSRETLEHFLYRHNIIGIQGVDTRALTLKLRTVGALRGVITTEPLTPEEAVARARSFHYLGRDFVKEVTTSAPYTWDENAQESLSPIEKINSLPAYRHRIVAYDFGIKRNILRRLRQHGFQVTVVPAETSAEDVLALKPDGLFLSNGPGDPSELRYVHENLRQLVGKIPIFGICLGHQMLTYALGGRTFKLKFGHRGGNQPVKDLRTGKVAITAQNHGFATDPESFKDTAVVITQINLNDGTCEALAHREFPIFSVQYHPEAAPGPNDAVPFFQEFSEMIATRAPRV
ncbi:MAG: glutamine-hydrolyzing carbamoyl-phosphate synthase small subunit [Methylacidiphilales bacterium]|nr:glutamine-hydrolyzing carbamoyl-phosphate synthase small subunit [Candidatus Methylacidiphilales bacterium]MDW8348908.1 glutamine-hydrolyzing carbamoyl-phosphate synthase small subunit [Verrucomicrobiae bacterium]